MISLLRLAGIEPLAYKASALQRRIPACLRRLGAGSLESSIEVARRRPALVAEIPGVVLLGVSSFFRDAEVWQWLESAILPEMLKKGGTLRVLSAGCSDGQELYSMAMLLAEAGALNGSTLLGLDCREDAILQARSGAYSYTALDDTPFHLREYFEAYGSGVRIIPSLRSAVEWKKSSLLSFRHLPVWDLILFRNLAIYLNESSGYEVWKSLAEGLKPGGVVVTGKAEKPPPDLGLIRAFPSIYKMCRGPE